jgi:hypothetical protein
MADHDILPGEADEVVAEPDWCGTRPDGRKVFAKGDLAVVVLDGMILTAYRLKKGEGSVSPLICADGNSNPE